MIKLREITDSASCLLKARMDEMIFVLLARDAVAPETLRYWAKIRVDRGYNKADDPQITEALMCAETMELQRPAIAQAQKTLPCNHVWDGPRIEVSPACSVATCSKCGEPAIDIKSLQRAETPVQPEAHE